MRSVRLLCLLALASLLIVSPADAKKQGSKRDKRTVQTWNAVADTVVVGDRTLRVTFVNPTGKLAAYLRKRDGLTQTLPVAAKVSVTLDGDADTVDALCAGDRLQLQIRKAKRRALVTRVTAYSTGECAEDPDDAADEDESLDEGDPFDNEGSDDLESDD